MVNMQCLRKLIFFLEDIVLNFGCKGCADCMKRWVVLLKIGNLVLCNGLYSNSVGGVFGGALIGFGAILISGGMLIIAFGWVSVFLTANLDNAARMFKIVGQDRCLVFIVFCLILGKLQCGCIIELPGMRCSLFCIWNRNVKVEIGINWGSGGSAACALVDDTIHGWFY